MLTETERQQAVENMRVFRQWCDGRVGVTLDPCEAYLQRWEYEDEDRRAAHPED